MPALTITAEGRASLWRQVHRGMRQRMNLLLSFPTAGRADLVARSIRRYAHNKGIGCVVKREEGTVMVLFL